MSTSKKSETPQGIVAAATALLAQRQAEHRTAIAHEKSLRDRLSIGDDSVSTSDLTSAAAEVERARLLSAAATEGLRKAKKEASRLDAIQNPSVAELVAALLAEHETPLGLRAIPILVVAEVPSEVEHLPSLFVVQEEATSHDVIIGSSGGKCKLVLVRDEAEPLDVAAIAKSLVKMVGNGNDNRFVGIDCFSVAGGRRSLGKHVVSQAAGITVRGLRTDVPVIQAPFADHVVRWFQQSVKQVVREAAKSLADGRAQRFAQVSVSDPVIVGTGDDGGVTRTGVELEVTAQLPPVFKVDGNLVGEALTEAIAGFTDRFVSGCGRCVSAELVDIEVAEGGRHGTARFVFVNRSAA